MLDVVYEYNRFINDLSDVIDASKYKKEYLMKQLDLSRATFYYKLKNQSFSNKEVMRLTELLFEDDAKDYEIRQALMQSREDSNNGMIRSHKEVMKDVRKKLA